MLNLHPHNQKTYNNLIKLYRQTNKVCCVQPTGTGKSFIILRLIEENPDKAFAVCSPSVYIFSQIKTHAEKHGISLDNCRFITYTKLAQTSIEELTELDCEYIVLDEFHRCGAQEWGNGVTSLLETHENAKVLGTSATPIRYLDSFRNMADELFNGVYAVNMSLAEAIRMKILPLPIYVTSWYSFRGEIERLEIRAEQSGNPRLKRVLLGKMQQAKRMINDLDCGIEKIFKKHIPNKNGKYIVFCPNIERLVQTAKECDSWFAEVNHNIHKYSVYSSNPDSEKQFEDFKNDGGNTALKLLFCVDMLNEGVHIDGVEGVIMLRATQSANVFYQQLGRALSCSNATAHPVIFDIVNNYETGDTAQEYAKIMDITRENGDGEYGEIEFELYDYVRDIRDILGELNKTFENSWDIVFDTLKEFVEKYNRFPNKNETYDGMRLGTWCNNQRVLYRQERLSQEQIDKLNSLNFAWNLVEENWNAAFEQLENITKKLGHFPKMGELTGEFKSLYFWISAQRTAFRNGTLTDEHKEKLLSIGCKLNPNVAEMWNLRYNQLKDFVEKNGRFPTYADKKQSEDLKLVYTWINSQKKKIRTGSLTDEQLEKLEAIGFTRNKFDDAWNQNFEILQKFIAEYNHLPYRQDTYDGFSIGVWFNTQINKKDDGSLSAERAEKFDKIIERFSAKKTKYAVQWDETFEKLSAFVAENGMPKYVPENKDELALYKWIYAQRAKFKKNELTDEQVEKLAEIGVRFK
jgi:superfamily II DNA or RNA helicase